MNETPQVCEESGRLVNYWNHVGEILWNIVIPDQRGGFFVRCKRENGEGPEEDERDESLSGDRIRRNGGVFDLEIVRSMKDRFLVDGDTRHPNPLLSFQFHLDEARLDLLVPKKWGVEGNGDLRHQG